MAIMAAIETRPINVLKKYSEPQVNLHKLRKSESVLYLTSRCNFQKRDPW